MSIEPIGLIVFGAGLLILWLGPSFGILVLAATCILGAAAAVQLPALGGASVQPGLVVLAFFTFAVFRFQRLRSAGLASLAFPRTGFWLVAAVGYGVITAIFLPRIFGGMTNVFSLARNDEGVGIVTLSLAPRASNATQSLYLVADLVCFAAVAGIAKIGRARSIARAILFAAGLNLAFAFLDLATYVTGTQDYLSVIRNANYRMLESGEIQGFKRIVGSFTEAGAYSYTTIGFYAFSISLWLDDYRSHLLGIIAGLSLLTLLLSTSSMAYLTLAIFSLILYASCVRRLFGGQASDRHFAYFLFAPIVLAGFVAGAVLVPALWNKITALFEFTITSKLSTQSGIERMQWNEHALASFFDTYGFGAGVGSIRASSFLVAVLANCGILGLLLFSAFFASIIFPSRPALSTDPNDSIVRAGAMACVALLLAATVSAGSVDLGLYFSIFAALSANRPTTRPPRPARPWPRRIFSLRVPTGVASEAFSGSNHAAGLLRPRDDLMTPNASEQPRTIPRFGSTRCAPF
jgi:hypothetical protein